VSSLRIALRDGWGYAVYENDEELDCRPRFLVNALVTELVQVLRDIRRRPGRSPRWAVSVGSELLDGGRGPAPGLTRGPQGGIEPGDGVLLLGECLEGIGGEVDGGPDRENTCGDAGELGRDAQDRRLKGLGPAGRLLEGSG
jgi:hypothetical protein